MNEAISVKPERRAAALDRMRHAEDRVDQLRIRRTEIELQQRRFHRVERFEALLEEGIVELREVERHARDFRSCVNSAPRPSSFTVVRKFSDMLASSTSRPASRRSRMNAASTCMPAVSQRFTSAEIECDARTVREDLRKLLLQLGGVLDGAVGAEGGERSKQPTWRASAGFAGFRSRFGGRCPGRFRQ